jgi:hypothetical protein
MGSVLGGIRRRSENGPLHKDSIGDAGAPCRRNSSSTMRNGGTKRLRFGEAKATSRLISLRPSDLVLPLKVSASRTLRALSWRFCAPMEDDDVSATRKYVDRYGTNRMRSVHCRPPLGEFEDYVRRARRGALDNTSPRRAAIQPPSFCCRTIPSPSRMTTSWSALTAGTFSVVPSGQRIIRSAEVAGPSPKCRRRSFAE